LEEGMERKERKERRDQGNSRRAMDGGLPLK